ncbi:hypothetical protein ACKC9G_00220 [Pokkaliibacter sp. CJK22405]|uniref:hypothetical protein n=1 Tax=Pokkaliibacter sp. CJK22405 TaxID=3384615 RepID=UPI0039852582
MNTSRFKPDFYTRIDWYAMDKNGHIALMKNFGWGDIPISLQSIKDWRLGLDEISEYLYEELTNYTPYPDKNGAYTLDIYSSFMYSHKEKITSFNLKALTKEEVEKALLDGNSRNKKLSDLSLVIRKGLYLFRGIEGYKEGDDTPVGYNGTYSMGDYYRHLIPSIFSEISDFPEPLRKYVCVSETVDFQKDRLLSNELIDSYFPKTYLEK